MKNVRLGHRSISGAKMGSISLLLAAYMVSGLLSCRPTPEIGEIGRDLGISIPGEYKLVKADSDPFALGADTKQVYVFEFDSVDCLQIQREIIHSVLYDTADAVGFDSLPLQKKLSILRVLADKKLTAYWVRDGSKYWFDGDALFLNTHDEVIARLYPNHIILPNRAPHGAYTGESGVPLWTVSAEFDIKKRTLYYTYVHI